MQLVLRDTSVQAYTCIQCALRTACAALETQLAWLRSPAGGFALALWGLSGMLAHACAMVRMHADWHVDVRPPADVAALFCAC